MLPSPTSPRHRVTIGTIPLTYADFRVTAFNNIAVILAVIAVTPRPQGAKG
jgi:hypothetical protein